MFSIEEARKLVEEFENKKLVFVDEALSTISQTIEHNARNGQRRAVYYFSGSFPKEHYQTVIDSLKVFGYQVVYDKGTEGGYGYDRMQTFESGPSLEIKW